MANPRSRDNQGSPSLSQNTEYSPPLLIPTPLSLGVVLSGEGRVTPALKVGQTFVGSFSLYDDRTVPPRIDGPSARRELEAYPLPTRRGMDLEC